MKALITTFIALLMALPAWAEVQIEEVTSPGGITAWLVEEPSIPFTALEIRFQGGTTLDAPGKRGAIYLMTALLEEGAADLDARAFARRQEELAASFNYDAYDDSVSISARFLTENRDEAVALLRTTLHEPRFDQDAIDRVRGQVISGLMSDAKDPRDIAASEFARLAYGDHPYASDGKGTVESVSALTRDDIVAAHRAVFARDRLFVSAVGDITPQALGTLLDTLFADLPATGAALPGPAEVQIGGGETVIGFDIPQSVVVFGQRGIDRDDDDFFAAYVMNHILGGGGFTSRLYSEVREKRGLAYSISSGLNPQRASAILVGGAGTANARVKKTLEVVKTEWQRMAKHGVTEDELNNAKTYLTGAYPLRFSQSGRIARILVGIQLAGLSLSYVQNRNDFIASVSRNDIARVAKRLLNLKRLVTVVVGRPKGLITSQ